MEFTKEKTNIAKGVAICLMFIHHLYPFSSRILNGNYVIPLIPSIDLESRIGFFGNICVSMFVFLSGYGMFLGYFRSDSSPLQYSLKKLKDFYVTYWTYFLVFIPIGFIFFKEVTLWDSNEIRYRSEWWFLIEGFIGWSRRYNEEWWFVRMFIILLLILCPLYFGLAKRNSVLLFTLACALFLFSWFFNIKEGEVYGFMIWQISFATGIIFAKSKIFSSVFIQNLDRTQGFIFFLPIFICFVVRHRIFSFYNPKLDFLLVPIFIYSVIRVVDLLNLSNVFKYLGKYSFPMWLVHSFFCYYYFQDFIYFPRWSPFIFILLTITSLLTAVLIERLRDYAGKHYAHLNNKLSHYLKQ